MCEEDNQVVGVDARVLGRPSEEEIGVLHDVLVQRATARDEHGQGEVAPAARAARLLPGAGDGSWKTGEDRGPELADVHPQLQRVGRHHAVNRPLAQSPFDGPTFPRQIAPAVAPHHDVPHALALQSLPQVGEQQLRGHAGAGEEDGLHALGQQGRAPLLRLQQVAAPQAQVPVHQGWIEEDDVLFPRGCAIAGHQGHGRFDEPLGMLHRVGDGGRGEEVGDIQVRRTFTRFQACRTLIEISDASQSPQHIGHMGPKDAPVNVDLIDDHGPQAPEECVPRGVMGQNARV